MSAAKRTSHESAGSAHVLAVWDLMNERVVFKLCVLSFGSCLAKGLRS